MEFYLLVDYQNSCPLEFWMRSSFPLFYWKKIKFYYEICLFFSKNINKNQLKTPKYMWIIIFPPTYHTLFQSSLKALFSHEIWAIDVSNSYLFLRLKLLNIHINILYFSWGKKGKKIWNSQLIYLIIIMTIIIY